MKLLIQLLCLLPILLAANIANAVTIPTYPAPGNFKGTPDPSYDGEYTLSWGKVSGAARYSLSGTNTTTSEYYQVFLGSGARSYSSSSLPSYLKVDGTHNFTVAACDSSLCSLNLASTTVTVSLKPLPLVSITNPDSDQDGAYLIDWPSSSGATHYELQEKIEGGIYTNLSTTVTDTSYSISDKSDGIYHYRVRACGPGGCSDYTEVIAGTTVVLRPESPSGLMAPVTNETGSYNVTWGASSGAVDSYDLDRRLNDGEWLDLYDGSGISFLVSELGDGTYDYRVKACHSYNGYTACSIEASLSGSIVARTPSVPEGITSSVAASFDGVVSLSWIGSAAVVE